MKDISKYNRCPHILSIQSHVAYGYVGNKAAVFPLQRLGCEVSVINTVQFSNHTGYKEWTGDIFSCEHIEDIYKGLKNLNVPETFNGILQGYLGDAKLGESILKFFADVKKENPQVLYCLDPVLGDDGRGIFVKPEVAQFLRDKGIKKADIITPNLFELSYLAQEKLTDLDSILCACEKIRKFGPKIVLVTSVMLPHDKSNIHMIANTQDKTWMASSPKLFFSVPPNGAGDVTAAIFLAKLLLYKDPMRALRETMMAVFTIFEKTYELGSRELAIIQSQENFINIQNDNIKVVEIG